jgi:hypothetical protein
MFISSIVAFDCIDSVSVVGNNDNSSFTNLNSSVDTLNLYKSSISLYSSINFIANSQISAIPGLVFTINMKQVVFANNTYTSNYASAKGGIFKIRGTMLASLISEKFRNNGETFDEKLTEYSSVLLKADPSGTNTYLLAMLNNGANLMKVILF